MQRNHLLQNTLARYCTCLHHRLAYISSLTNTPCGILELDFISNSMLGVSAGGLLGSPLTGVIGLSLIIFSDSVISVCSCSSVSICSLASLSEQYVLNESFFPIPHPYGWCMVDGNAIRFPFVSYVFLLSICSILE